MPPTKHAGIATRSFSSRSGFAAKPNSTALRRKPVVVRPQTDSKPTRARRSAKKWRSPPRCKGRRTLSVDAAKFRTNHAGSSLVAKAGAERVERDTLCPTPNPSPSRRHLHVLDDIRHLKAREYT